ncbi:MAG TPA: hypothetical protein VL020_04210 [Pseudomonadales bacterium]|nr:hypothetical protein [Pseudomonadales bacterium]
MKKYTEEKVLYFANQKTGLHVQSSERARNTTLWGLVCRLVASNKIHCIAEDDSGKYYMTTKSGDIALLEMQIDWRERNGKCAEDKHNELAGILEEVKNEN